MFAKFKKNDLKRFKEILNENMIVEPTKLTREERIKRRLDEIYKP